MVRPIRLSIEAIDRRLEAAAGTLGANPLAVFATVTLPLALPGIVAGGILGFAKGMGEFGATITFVSNIPGETRTLALAIYTFTQIPGGEVPALRLTLIAVVVSMAALIASEIARPHARAADRGMSGLEVDVAGRVGSFDVEVGFASDGGVTALFGHSGAGKTTVINMIGGVVRPARGRVVVGGRVLFDAARGIDLPPHRRRLGHVFQEGRLFPHLSVKRNLLYGRWFARGPRDPRRFDEVVELLASVGCWSGGRARCPAASGSGSRSAARCCASRRRS